jgi:uncharacterized membrane protein YuzA (DUF378 family)
MASHNDDERDLPHVWPFTFAGVLIIAALSWFCLGFALHDVGTDLTGHYAIFFALLGLAGALIVGAAAVNITKEQRRRAH